MIALLLVSGVLLTQSDAGADSAERAQRLTHASLDPIADPAPQLTSAWRAQGTDALREALEHQLDEDVAQSQCAPPSPAEVEAQARQLDDFRVLRVAAVDGGFRDALTASPLSAQERADLAYLLAAVADEPKLTSAPRKDLRQSSSVETGWEAQLAEADAKRDLARVTAVGRAALAALDRPVDHFWPVSWDASTAFSDLAAAEEVQRMDAEAAEIYRHVRGAIWCGNCADSSQVHRIRGLIRSEEAQGHCRAVVIERLQARGSDSDDARYGPDRLARVGFDLERIDRGAQLTENRRDQKAMERALAQTPAALTRLAQRGTEDFLDEIAPLRGLVTSSASDEPDQVLTAPTAGNTAVVSS